MNIKQASEQSGVSAPNIRFYEKEGLFTPARRQGNDYRDYTAGDVRTLKLIRMLRMLDVPLPARREKLLRILRIAVPPVCTFAAILAAGWVVTGGAGWFWLAVLVSAGVLLGRCFEKWL